VRAVRSHAHGARLRACLRSRHRPAARSLARRDPHRACFRGRRTRSPSATRCDGADLDSAVGRTTPRARAHRVRASAHHRRRV